jgi:carbamoyl-phosphate synthase small subunit
MKKGYLVLQDGQVFAGERFGAEADSVGELVFTTGMCGYLETLTDPSYAGQIVTQTFPLSGNYGVIPPDFEGETRVRGYIVRECCDAPSNFRSEGTLDAFLKEKGIPGLRGVDTRRLTRILRENGVMNAMLCSVVPEDLAAIAAYRVADAVAEVTCGVPQTYPAEGAARWRVALLDYGMKRNILRELQKRGCAVTVCPADTQAETILGGGYDGVMLSNGPGDPAENEYEISQIAKLVGQVPVFGICLGHQLCALAMGGRTYKLKYGHRGANQPVTNGKRTWITTQNHGYAVENASMAGIAELSFYNANDRSCEGLEYPGRRCFTVQFHPEACAGPHDTEFLFDRFLRMMRGEEA